MEFLLRERSVAQPEISRPLLATRILGAWSETFRATRDLRDLAVSLSAICCSDFFRRASGLLRISHSCNPGPIFCQRSGKLSALTYKRLLRLLTKRRS